jgi:hypothetical protein
LPAVQEMVRVANLALAVVRRNDVNGHTIFV